MQCIQLVHPLETTRE